MPRCCSVICCRSNYVGETEGYVSTFSLPKDKSLREIWIRNMRTDLNKLKHPYVCAKHFCEEDVIWEEKCIVRGEVKYFRRKIPKLRKGAVPKIFDVPSSRKIDAINLQKVGENQSKESVDEAKLHQNVITRDSPIHGRLTDFEQQSAELENTYIGSDESNLLDQAKDSESSKLMISNDSLDESSSEIPPYWTNNIIREQENQDMDWKKNDVENNDIVKKELIQTNSQVTKYLEKSNDIKFNMLQAMKLSNKLKLAKLKIKCKIYDLDLDSINNDE